MRTPSVSSNTTTGTSHNISRYKPARSHKSALSFSPLGHPPTMRSVIPLDSQTKQQFPDNTVINSRYTLYNFLPKNLFEQFRKPLNFYFLLVALLQFISVIAPVNPLSTLLPLLFAFSLTAAKEGYDDVKRHQQDALYNNRRYKVYSRTARDWVSVPCHSIGVGDVLLLSDGDEIPSDCVCVASPSDSDGTIYIRTDNLDGEVDLKPRDVLPLVHFERYSSDAIDSAVMPEPYPRVQMDQDLLVLLSGIAIVCPPPCAPLDSFDARLELIVEQNRRPHDNHGNNGAASSQSNEMALNGARRNYPLSASHLLPQATYLKNTANAIVVVVYTGNDTKCGMNKRPAPEKWAQIDRRVSAFSKVIFGFQMVVALSLGIAGDVINQQIDETYWYLKASPNSIDSGAKAGGLSFLVYPLRYFLLTTVMIPVSFKFVVDLSKQFMAMVLQWDLAMTTIVSKNPTANSSSSSSSNNKTTDHHGSTQLVGVTVRNSSIVEDLGQVEYVLSDKTGTLTNNEMVLRSLALVDGSQFTTPWSVVSPAGEAIQRNSTHFITEQLDLFLQYIMLCHTVELEAANNSDHLNDDVKEEGVAPHYVAASPDELAIVSGVGKFGYRMLHRTKNDIQLLIRGVEHRFHILRVFPFSSEKKCMGILVRPHTPSISGAENASSVLLIVKGADDRLFSLSNVPLSAHQALSGCLTEFASEGLRTLVYGAKTLTHAQYIEFETEYNAALSSLVNRKEQVDALEQRLEIGLTMIGATAIEDKLQEFVPETISDLMEANIRFWMLTGDKVETAEQISVSCRLLDRAAGDHVVRVTGPGWESQLRASEALTLAKPLTRIVLIVQGGAVLDNILSSADLSAIFKKIAFVARSVVCARVTPSQKAVITELVRSHGFTTLAIGDGGNDVAMIQCAHVGIGICGKEGTQASRAADFSIGQFSHLRSLLFVHGHMSYTRTAYVIQYSFYKSMLISFIQLVFNCVCTKYSGASYWNSFDLTMWNGVYTLPQTLFYCLDRVAPRSVLERNPSLYRLPQSNFDLNVTSFFRNFVLRGALQSALFFFLTMKLAGGPYYADAATGDTSSHAVLFTLTYTALIVHQLLTVVLESHSITWLNFVVLLGMPVVYWLSILAFSSFSPKVQFYQVFQHTQTIQGTLIVLVLALILFLPQFAVQAWCHCRSPDVRTALTLQEKCTTGRIGSTFNLRNGGWRKALKRWLSPTKEASSIYLAPRQSQANSSFV